MMIDKIGEDSHIHQGVEVLVENPQGDGRGITIGSHCIIYPRNRLVLGDMGANPQANLTIGDRVLINAGGYLSGEGGLTVDDYVMIGANACILSAGHRYEDPQRLIQEQGLTYGPVHLKRGVWVGAGAVVLQGLTVGEGAVIGAGSVVTRDIPPLAVVVGNPARIIKYRGTPAPRGTGLLRRLLNRFSRADSGRR